MELKKINDNIFFFENDESLNNINFNYLNHQNKNIEKKEYNNILFDFNDNNHEYKFKAPLTYNIELFKYISKYIYKLPENTLNNCRIIDSGILFIGLSQNHQSCTHIMLDFSNQLEFFYHTLKNNKDYKLIIDICPFHYIFDFNKKHRNKKDHILKKEHIRRIQYTRFFINKFVKLIRDFGIKNEIIFFNKNIRNIKENKIFIRKLFSVNYKNFNDNFNDSDVFNLISLSNLLNPINIFPEIIKKKEIREKKYLIFEVRPTNRLRGLGLPDEILKILNEYCEKNNLELFLWDKKFTTNDYYKQYLVSYNAKIIIGYGGSLWYWTKKINNGKCLFMNCSREFSKLENEILTKFLHNISFYNYYNILSNKKINCYFHYHDFRHKKPLELEIYINMIKKFLEIN